MKNFADRLIGEINRKKSVAVVGLDPRIESIPEHITKEAKDKFGETFQAIGYSFFEFNKRIIDKVFPHVAVIKPQMAFYEAYGPEGITAFKKTVAYGKKKGLLVIEDAKRNDIGSTAKAYSNGHLGNVEVFSKKENSFDVDAITVNAYLGTDGVSPFVNACQEFGKGMFVLVKTSNKSSGDLQDVKLADGRTVFELMASFVNQWGQEQIGSNGYSSVGAVVGATYPEQAKVLRTLMQKSFFLVPGYGAQGGSAKDTLNCFNDDGLGAIVNSSRGIIFAYKKPEFQCSETEFEQASEKAIIKMNQEINKALKEQNKIPW